MFELFLDYFICKDIFNVNMEGFLLIEEIKIKRVW